MARPRTAVAAAAALVCAAASADGPPPAGAIGSWAPLAPTAFALAAARESSGTSWAPEGAPSGSWYSRLGRLDAAVRWNVFLALADERSRRGATGAFGAGWLAAATGRDLGAWHLSARAALSPEPLTVSRPGYPLLFQTGETSRGAAVVDRQRGQPMLLEAALLARLELLPGLGLEGYAAAAGEPALGPPGAARRLSALHEPAAPLGAAALEPAHAAPGVLTAGVFGRRVKLEASAFGARPAGEPRATPERPRLDSAAARVSLALGRRAVVSASWGRLARTPAAGRGGDVAIASATYGDRVFRRGAVALTAAAGGGAAGRAALAEGSLTVDGRWALFGRAEWAERSAEALRVGGLPAARGHGVGRISLGASLPVARAGPGVLALGVRGALALAPGSLAAAYGAEPLAGLALFAQVRPALRRGGGLVAREAWRDGGAP